LLSVAQKTELSSENRKAIKAYKHAQKAIGNMDYADAKEALEAALEYDDGFIEALMLLGNVYKLEGREEETVETYKKIISIDSNYDADIYYFLGNYYFEKGDYHNAITSYSGYLNFEGQQYKKVVFAQYRIDVANYRLTAEQNPVIDKIDKLEETINTKADEFINYVNIDENELIFNRKELVYNMLNGKKQSKEYFLLSKKSGNSWLSPKEVIIKNTEAYNKGGMNLSFDASRMFFTGCGWPKGRGGCDIYTTVRKGDKWSTPTALSMSVNSGADDKNACVSADGKRLYFASARKGGKGGSDIWMSTKLDNGKWSLPVNLGDEINTSGDELAPFIHPDGQTLYYSSDGSQGMGGLDLMISRRLPTGDWEEGVNMGFPINSKNDDLSIFPAMDGSKAWISSNREGDYNIYSFNLPDNLKPGKILNLKGIVTDINTGAFLNCKVEITNEINTLISISSTNPKNGEFLSVLSPEKNYNITIFSKGYFYFTAPFTTPSSLSLLRKNFELVKIERGALLNIYNIFYEEDKWELLPESMPELDRLRRLMLQNPGIKFVIEGHSDNIGDEAHIMMLSERRAWAVRHYLISNDVEPEMVIYKGYGHRKPIASNSTAAGRKLNNRITIRVK